MSLFKRTPDPRVVADPHRLPPGQVLTEKWPVLHYGVVPTYDMTAWRMRIHGAVENELTLSYDELKALPTKTVHCDIHCVTTWSRLDNDFLGVPFSHLCELVRPKPSAHFVVFHCHAGFTTSLPLDALLDEDVLITWQHDGQPLTPEHGFPVRGLVPLRYFWKSAKWIEAIEFVEHDQLGFWERAGYNNEADPWKEQRYW